VGRSHPSPAAWDGQKNVRLFGNEIRLLLRREHQVAVTLFLGGERGEYPASDAEIGRAHVRALFGTFQIQRNSAKIGYSHCGEIGRILTLMRIGREGYNLAMRCSLRNFTPLLVVGIGVALCGRSSAQITGTIKSSVTGKPISGALVMGESLNWTQSDSDGHYNLPPAKFKRVNSRPEVPVSFRAEGYRPVTRIAQTENQALEVALDDGTASTWRVPLCKDAGRAKPPCGTGTRTRRAIGYEMLLNVPCDSKDSQAYSDIDYSGDVLSYNTGNATYYLRTMAGAWCCAGHPLAGQYLNSRSFTERAWLINWKGRRIDGLDARGVSHDGTYWRWVGPLVGELAEYNGADSEAAKYFDAILDGICFQPKF
jgi:hypothetical protein